MKKRLLGLFSIILVLFLLVSCGESKLEVSFDLNGGVTETSIIAQKLDYGDLVNEPIEPTKEGFVFSGWTLNGKIWNFEMNKVKESITLVASWTKKYNVSFNAPGANHLPNTQAIVDGKKAKTPIMDPSMEGKQFLGWYLGEDLFDFNTPITENTELYAKWEDLPEAVSEDFEEIVLTIVDDMIEFPERGPLNNIKLVWRSKNPAFITPAGVVNKPLKSLGDVDVVVTASTTYAGKVYTRDFIVTVKAKEEVVITSELEIDFLNLTNEYEVLDSSILAFFVDNGNLPYLDVESFLLLLDGLIHADELSFEYNDLILKISYEVTDEEEDETYYYEALIDFYEGTIYTEVLSFFSGYIKETATDYSEGINYVDYYIEKGDPVFYDLAKYQVEMIVHEVEDEVYYLMPYNFLSMIFTSETYYNFYYNGDNFYGFYAIPSANDEDDEYNTYETIKVSTLNNTKVPQDIALSSFHQTAFIFDYYFGLRHDEFYNIESSFYEKIGPSIDNYLKSTDSFNRSLRTFILKTLDELHSSYHFPGYYNRPSYTIPLFITDLGPRVVSWYEDGLWEVQDSIDYWFNDDREGYKFLDKDQETALIYLDGFLTASVDEEKTSENDSDTFMKETLEAIFSENPNVKNIGIDLSYNTGGNIGALLRVLGFITEQPIEMSYMNTLTNQNSTYFIELDQDAYEDVNWFFITSPVTFSAANLMTAIVKNQNLGPIFGTTSGGGAASITPFVFAEGTMISISSNSLLSIRTQNRNGSYKFTNIENGIEPDLYLSPYDTQNPQKILDLLEQYFS